MNKKNMILRLFLKYFIIYLIVEIAILFIFGKADIVIKTSDNNYNVNCNFMIKSNGDEYFTEDKIKVNLMELELNYSTLVNVDSDIDNMFGNNIFVIDDYIYYYKNNSDKLFRYNKKDNVIEEFNTSKFVNRTEVTTSIGIRTIESEALLNYYPEIIKHIDKIDGTYKHQMFYDKDRIFFVVDNDVYEYHILRDRTRLVMKDIDENIEYIFVK
ncbi:MAG: hypothetical protein ACI4OP_03650 [Candidatus Coprovivens sp.]